jgi:hypothetical protein
MEENCFALRCFGRYLKSYADLS